MKYQHFYTLRQKCKLCLLIHEDLLSVFYTFICKGVCAAKSLMIRPEHIHTPMQLWFVELHCYRLCRQTAHFCYSTVSVQSLRSSHCYSESIVSLTSQNWI